MNTTNFSSLPIKEWTEVDFSETQRLSILYCRLSQDDGRAGESDSIVNQKKLLGDFAGKEKLTNPVFFIDDGYTGTNFNRPAITKALELVEQGKIENFVVKDASRLGRDYLKVGQLMEITFPTYDIRFIAITDNIDSNEQSTMDSMLVPIKNMLNELYAKDISIKVRTAQKSMVEAGKRLSGNPHYGFKLHPEDSKIWIIDDEAAEIVRRIFSEAKSGKSAKQIAEGLSKDNIETPSHRRVSLGENVAQTSYLKYGWGASMIVKILARPEYLGHTVNYRSTTKSYKNKKKIFLPEEEWVISKNTHEAIIDQETFDIVQKMRKHQRRIPRKNWRDKPGHENIFAGLVYCGSCGHKHTYCASEKNGINLDHYKCSRYGKVCKPCINAHYIRKNLLEQIVLEDVNEMLATVNVDKEKFIQKLQEKLDFESHKTLNKKRQKLASNENRILSIDRIIQQLYEDKLDGQLTNERFASMCESYELEQTHLRTEVKRLREELMEKEQTSADISKFMTRIDSLTHLDKLSTSIVNEMINKIIIHKPEGTTKNRIYRIDVEYNFIGKL